MIAGQPPSRHDSNQAPTRPKPKTPRKPSYAVYPLVYPPCRSRCDANTPFPPVERAALSAYCTWRFLQRTSPPREDSEAEDSHAEEEEVAPCTPVNKPAPAPSGGPFSGISAIDLVKVACSTRKRARDEEDLATSSSEEAAESAATPQSKHAKKLSPCAGDGGYGFGQKEVRTPYP